MRIDILNLKQTVKALAVVAKIVPSKTPKDILKSVRITSDGGPVDMMATRLDQSIRLVIPGMASDGPVDCLVPFASLYRVLKASKVTTAVLEILAGSVRFCDGGSTQMIPLCEAGGPDDFPILPVQPEGPRIGIKAADLLRMISRTHYATDEDSTRYAMGGVLFEVYGPNINEGPRVSFVGTDGRQLAQQFSACQVDGCIPDHRAIGVVPLSALKAIEGFVRPLRDETLWFVPGDFPGATAGIVHVSTDDGRIQFCTRLVAGRFPRYRDSFPGDPVVTARIDSPAALATILQQAATHTTEDSRGAELTITGGRIILSVERCGATVYESSLAVQDSGPGREATIDPRYLVDMLRSIGDQTGLRVAMIDHKSIIEFRTDDNFSYFVMPLTRDDDRSARRDAEIKAAAVQVDADQPHPPAEVFGEKPESVQAEPTADIQPDSPEIIDPIPVLPRVKRKYTRRVVVDGAEAIPPRVKRKYVRKVKVIAEPTEATAVVDPIEAAPVVAQPAPTVKTPVSRAAESRHDRAIRLRDRVAAISKGHFRRILASQVLSWDAKNDALNEVMANHTRRQSWLQGIASGSPAAEPNPVQPTPHDGFLGETAVRPICLESLPAFFEPEADPFVCSAADELVIAPSPEPTSMAFIGPIDDGSPWEDWLVSGPEQARCEPRSSGYRYSVPYGSGRTLTLMAVCGGSPTEALDRSPLNQTRTLVGKRRRSYHRTQQAIAAAMKPTQALGRSHRNNVGLASMPQ